ncbi:MAG: Panacea domain-containing protein [Alphaproteobacteria bacterium]|nr:MAG: hypothetical protein B6I23_02320 [Rickettsiaceae bacterium 4572_127]
MANVFNVAKFILEKSINKISTMKLQKLCYYSQAWNLVWEDKPLFKEEIQAFANGPVIRKLYDLHKGNFSIDASFFTKEKLSNNNLTDKEQKNILKVMSYYGEKSPQWLSDLSHIETPWKDARNGCSAGERCEKEITIESMLEYYSSL